MTSNNSNDSNNNNNNNNNNIINMGNKTDNEMPTAESTTMTRDSNNQQTQIIKCHLYANES